MKNKLESEVIGEFPLTLNSELSALQLQVGNKLESNKDSFSYFSYCCVWRCSLIPVYSKHVVVCRQKHHNKMSASRSCTILLLQPIKGHTSKANWPWHVKIDSSWAFTREHVSLTEIILICTLIGPKLGYALSTFHSSSAWASTRKSNRINV